MATELYRFFDSTADDPRVYQADDWAGHYRELFSDGIKNGGANLMVSPGTGMKAKVLPGFALIQGYAYWLEYDSEEDSMLLTLPESHAALPRIDRVVLRLSTSQQDRFIKLFVIPGTPAAAPVAPALTRTPAIHELSLARVAVPAGALAITAQNITDERLNGEVCGLINGLVTLDASEFERQAREAIENITDMDNKQDKITATGLLKGNGTGGVTAAVAGTDYPSVSDVNGKQAKITASGLLKGNGNGSVSAAVGGADYATPAQVSAKQNKVTCGTGSPPGSGAEGDVYIQY